MDRLPASKTAVDARKRIFALEFIKDFNATRAAIAAGYSEKTAVNQASRLLTDVKVQELIRAEQERLQRIIQIDVEHIVFELARCGFYNIADTIDPDTNNVLPVHNIPKDTQRAITNIKQTTTTSGRGENAYTTETIEYKLANKLEALEKLGRHLGMFNKDNAGKRQPAPIRIIINGEEKA